MKRILIAVITMITVVAQAQAQEPRTVAPVSGVSVHFENDHLFHDRHYTHGTEIRYRSEEGYIGCMVGQLMYTPMDISVVALQTNDRPFGAWLYAGVTHYRPSNVGRELEIYEWKIGVVGPHAYGKEVQTYFHSHVFSGADPRGWGNQLQDELALSLRYAHLYRKERELLGADVRLTGGYGATVGNVHMNGNIEMGLQFGWNIPNNFGSDVIVPTARGASDWSLYVFAESKLRIVFINMFLDGNTDNSSHYVDKRDIVEDYSIGLAARYKRVGIDYSVVHRTDEYVGQPERTFFSCFNITVAL